MSVRIRAATLADYAAFALVAHEVHEHHVAAVPDVFRSVSVVIPEELFADLINSNDSEVHVAEADGAIAGYAVLLHRRLTRAIQVPRVYAFIDNFGVAKAYRRTGVGRQLFEACIASAREHGASSLELDCWEANAEAVQFYASMGMKLKRRWLALDL
jgi:ribosomal protein S18 acetylase RimI-like enzyme